MNQELCELLNEKYKQIRELQITIGELEKELKAWVSTALSFERELIIKEDEIDELKKIVSELELEVETLSTKIDELELDKVETKIRNEVDREAIKFFKPQKLMHYEDRNILSCEIGELVDKYFEHKLETVKLFKLVDEIENLLEPYTTGDYRNYN